MLQSPRASKPPKSHISVAVNEDLSLTSKSSLPPSQKKSKRRHSSITMPPSPSPPPTSPTPPSSSPSSRPPTPPESHHALRRLYTTGYRTSSLSHRPPAAEASLQSGFDAGIEVGKRLGVLRGVESGVLEGILGAMGKEPSASEGRDKMENLLRALEEAGDARTEGLVERVRGMGVGASGDGVEGNGDTKGRREELVRAEMGGMREALIGIVSGDQVGRDATGSGV